MPKVRTPARPAIQSDPLPSHAAFDAGGDGPSTAPWTERPAPYVRIDFMDALRNHALKEPGRSILMNHLRLWRGWTYRIEPDLAQSRFSRSREVRVRGFRAHRRLKSRDMRICLIFRHFPLWRCGLSRQRSPLGRRRLGLYIRQRRQHVLFGGMTRPCIFIRRGAARCPLPTLRLHPDQVGVLGVQR